MNIACAATWFFKQTTAHLKTDKAVVCCSDSAHSTDSVCGLTFTQLCCKVTLQTRHRGGWLRSVLCRKQACTVCQDNRSPCFTDQQQYGQFCSPFTAMSLEAGETLLPGSRWNTRHVMATSPPLRMAGVVLYVKSLLVHAWLVQETILRTACCLKRNVSISISVTQIQILRMSSPDHISDYRIFLIPSDFQPAAVYQERMKSLITIIVTTMTKMHQVIAFSCCFWRKNIFACKRPKSRMKMLIVRCTRNQNLHISVVWRKSV